MLVHGQLDKNRKLCEMKRSNERNQKLNQNKYTNSKRSYFHSASNQINKNVNNIVPASVQNQIQSEYCIKLF